MDGEIVERNYEALLEEIRHSVGEVGRINETLGRSLSWNSLSLQNTVESTGRLLHVMVRPKDGRTTIRITESAGQLPVILTASCALVTIAGASLGGDALGGLGGYAVSAVAALGASYTGARAFYRRYINRRFRKLRELMDRLTRHTMDAADATTTPNAER